MLNKNYTIPKGWKETTLGEVAEIIMGQSPSGESYNLNGDGIPFYQGVTEFGDKYVDIKKYTDQPTKIVEENTILFSVRAPVGRVNFTRHKACIGRGNAGLRMNNNQQEFLYYLLKNNEKAFLNNATGTVFDSISGSELRNFEIIIPEDEEEQRAIAAVLSSFDDKIELLREENKTLEAIAQAIFKEWFVNFNFPGATGKMIDSELGKIPEGWRVGRLRDFGKIICGKTPAKASPEYFGGDIPFIKIPDMHGQVFISKTEDSLTEEGANTQRKKFIPANSICVSCIATVGLVSIASQLSQTNQQINSIIPEKFEYVEYLFLTLRRMKGDLLNIGTGGSATLNINTGTFSDIKIIFPEDNIFNNFHCITKPIFEKINFHNSQIQNLSFLRDTLLPKLVRGEIAVNFS